MDGASGLWLFAVLGGPVILAFALIYGVWQWRHRRRRLDTLREQATRGNYRAENERRPTPSESAREDETRA